MRVAIDSAGRIVVPKPLRDRLGLSPTVELEIEAVEGHLELRPLHAGGQVREGPHGPVVVGGEPISDEEVRDVLESVRERR